MLADWEIIEEQNKHGIFSIFHENQQRHEESGTSYGLTSHGYDIALGNGFIICGSDYKNLDEITLKPNECVLAHSAEYIKMPPHLKGALKGKSTLLRKFLSFIHEAPIEAEWEGQITLEIKNMHHCKPITLYAGQGIGQLELTRVLPARKGYGKGGNSGKYQRQTGVTEAR